jgi:hypothetical protein
MAEETAAHDHDAIGIGGRNIEHQQLLLGIEACGRFITSACIPAWPLPFVHNVSNLRTA